MVNKTHVHEKKSSASLNDDEIQKLLANKQVKDIDHGINNIQKIIKHLNDYENIKAIPKILNYIMVLGNNDKVLDNFTRLIAKTNNKNDLLDSIINNNLIQKIIPSVLSLPYFSQIIIDHCDWLTSLLEDDLSIAKSKEIFLKELLEFKQISKNPLNKEDFNYICLYKQRETFEIAIKELIGDFDFFTLEKELSYLADACLQHIYEEINDYWGKKHNMLNIGSYAIIALDRLGAKELSYNTPLRLLFIYDNISTIPENKDHLSLYKYYTTVTQQIIKIIQPYKGNTLYAIKYPKRSEKDIVPQLYTTEDYIRYLENSDSFFHCFQLTKARFAAGNETLGKHFEQALRPMVYKKYHSKEDIFEIKNLLGGFNVLENNNLKNIELMIQLIQLAHGGTNPEIRSTNTYKAIHRLFKAHFITNKEVHILEQGFLFFKQMEHKIELLGESNFADLIEHKHLPETLADLMGYSSQADIDNELMLLEDYYQIAYNVKAFFNDYFKILIQNERLYFFYMLYQKPEQFQNLLKNYHFSNPKIAYFIIKELIPASQIGRERFTELLTLFLREVQKSSDPDLYLVNFAKVVQSYQAKDMLYDFLIQNKNLFHLLANLFSNSQFLSEILIKYPELFDKLANPDYLKHQYSSKKLKKAFHKVLKVKPFDEAIYILKNYVAFRIGLKKLQNINHFKRTSYELSILAQTILTESLSHFYKKISAEKGKPDSDIAIILLGKLGGKELTFGSDLDIFFVYEKKGEIKPGYYNSLFFTELITKLTHFFSYPGPFGTLYEVDLKIRPDGRNAPMVISAPKFADYLKKKGAVWEKLAYTKAHVISTSPQFETSIKKIIHDFVFSPLNLVEFRKEVADMRERILCNAVKKSPGQCLFKKGKGGLLDLEFLAEYLTIYFGIDNLGVRKRNIFNMFSSLCFNNYLSRDEYEVAYSSLTFLRKIENVLRIMSNFSSDKLPESDEDLKKLAVNLNFPDTEAFLAKYQVVTEQVRLLYSKFLLV